MHPELPESYAGLPIGRLAQAFNSVTNAYKFYWFKALLDMAAQDRAVMPMQELSMQMLASVWYPLDHFKLSFGKQDGFKAIAQRLSGSLRIDHGPSAPSLFQQVFSQLPPKEIDQFQRELAVLLRWVPYRFQQPFFSEQLLRISDQQKNRLTVKLANEAFLQGRGLCLYRYPDDAHIELDRYWMDYMRANHAVLQGFVNWHLIRFVQKNNPNVIGLASKLERPAPNDRNLSQERKYWELYLKEHPEPASCIYSGQPLQGQKIAIDHFIPWSYVVHNDVWNLTPTLPAVNSSKSDWLPDLDAYLPKFAQQQYHSLQWSWRHRNALRDKCLHSYAQLFGSQLSEIAAMEAPRFEQELGRVVKPLVEGAERLGFPVWWRYRGEG
jgi:hypothetical protein